MIQLEASSRRVSGRSCHFDGALDDQAHYSPLPTSSLLLLVLLLCCAANADAVMVVWRNVAIPHWRAKWPLRCVALSGRSAGGSLGSFGMRLAAGGGRRANLAANRELGWPQQQQQQQSELEIEERMRFEIIARLLEGPFNWNASSSYWPKGGLCCVVLCCV